MSNKQSSVEWLADEEDKLFTSYQKGFMNTARYILLKYRLLEQAKEMHKDEIYESFETAKINGMEISDSYNDGKDFNGITCGMKYYEDKFGTI